MLHLSYASLVIRVEGADPAPLAWLEEFLGGTFDAAALDAPPHSTVRLAPGPLPPGEPAGEMECFSLDGGFLKLPAERAADGSVALHDGKDRIAYVFRGRDVAIHAPGDGPALRLGLLRVVRELATAHALREGQLCLHAAAADAGDGPVAIAGPRRSGKTTLLLHALLDGGARYLTNDRLLVDLRGGLLARGMPTIVSLREDTLARFPSFAGRLFDSRYARDRTLAEAAATTLPARPNLSPRQLRELAGAGEAPAGALRAAVFPSVAPDVERFRIAPLGAEEAAAAVRRGLFLAAVPERPAAAFAGGMRPRGEAELTTLCRELASRIPCFALSLGPRAYEGPALWSAIRERAR